MLFARTPVAWTRPEGFFARLRTQQPPFIERLARLRKTAGKVCDMDVLTDFASTVRQPNVPTFGSAQGRLFRQKRNAENQFTRVS
jgi:hypothetical protein